MEVLKTMMKTYQADLNTQIGGHDFEKPFDNCRFVFILEGVEHQKSVSSLKSAAKTGDQEPISFTQKPGGMSQGHANDSG